ncbi:cytochrome c oxidase accessory protein CcoG [Hahella sp. SMD15-11]|uniref:Cytochrome c oxidase accessory protein CcoG n=1 Tax=Thermohahella caldifontis TaxID=3142973 RepID=A0AB39UYP4_9GAMM
MGSKFPVKNVTQDKPASQTIELYESRKRIYPKEVKGRFQRIRTVTLWMLMAAYFGFLWIPFEGQQLIYFDLPHRQFHLFGTTFWPQDFYLLALLLITAAFGLFFVTTLFGRIWCGYTCPQTAWTFIFMWIDERVEGSRNQRIKLDVAPWTTEKILKKSVKHGLWLFVAFWTAVTFVGYFYPIRELIPDLFTLNADSGWAYFWVFFFTAATYINAGWMREQVCLYMCPYARFQSVMYDQDTWAVSYDYNRGEPRGKRKKGVDHKALGLGDCVDCTQCVQVCPTGIDIRDGLQYECIGCALCIDACDEIMDKMGYPRGLIRYSTEHELEGKQTHVFRLKSVGYGLAMLTMIGAIIFLLGHRVPIDAEAIRDRGQLFQTSTRGYIENAYTLKLANMDTHPHKFKVEVSGIPGAELVGDSVFEINASSVREIPVTVEVPPESLENSRYEIEFVITAVDNPKLTKEIDSRFIGPTRGY